MGDVPFSQTPQIKKYRVGWLEKSHALSLERERDDETRADATERDSLRRRGSFLRGGESMLLPKMVVRIIARTSDARTTCDLKTSLKT